MVELTMHAVTWPYSQEKNKKITKKSEKNNETENTLAVHATSWLTPCCWCIKHCPFDLILVFIFIFGLFTSTRTAVRCVFPSLFWKTKSRVVHAWSRWFGLIVQPSCGGTDDSVNWCCLSCILFCFSQAVVARNRYINPPEKRHWPFSRLFAAISHHFYRRCEVWQVVGLMSYFPTSLRLS